MHLKKEDIVEGKRVRLLGNTLKQGVLTGRIKETSRDVLAEVYFGPAETVYKRISLIEPIKMEGESVEDLIFSGRFGKLKDFRIQLSAFKVGSDLTDIFYSLGQDRTTFFPHQFLPVLKFIQSIPGRLLIADEVGLGKTIEATYIWKEIEARHDANTWLIICPAMLKDKWQGDLQRLFSINARQVSADELLKEIESIERGDRYKERIIISSLEGIRINKRLWDFLDESISSSISFFDLITVDEAHYLRNPGTKSHQIIRVLRELTTHFLLLSATPIQTQALNLYNLLKLLEPEDFNDQQTFELQIEQNSYIVEAIRRLSTNSKDNSIGMARQLLEYASNLSFLSQNALLGSVIDMLSKQDFYDREKRLFLSSELEKVSLFHRFISRTRKRDVITAKVIRETHAIEINFTNLEGEIYERLSKTFNSEYHGTLKLNIFALIMRQRQMASSLPAAIRAWRKKINIAEQFWDDFGFLNDEILDTPIIEAFGLSENEYKDLVKQDSKYKMLRDLLYDVFKKRPDTKVILFSYFRETLLYLFERLSDDGFQPNVLMGGVNDKSGVIDTFMKSKDIQILLSSEVGSEGVDLQFCQILINYDLPWNPMKVEQRIGRIDRIGQEAEKILIYNLVRMESIEERILYRLLDRIGVFRISIGELEEIIGTEMEQLVKDLFNPDLSNEQREARGRQTEEAILNKQRIQTELEDEAWQLSGLTDYLISQINQKKEVGHWVRPLDLKNLIIDYLETKYPGCKIEQHREQDTILITLSRESVSELQNYIEKNRITAKTNLTRHQEVILDFNPNSDILTGKREAVTIRHPLVRWISYNILKSKLSKLTVCIEMAPYNINISPGNYIFGIYFFSTAGLFRKRELMYAACCIQDLRLLSAIESELIVNTALEKGSPYHGISLNMNSFENLTSAWQKVNNSLLERFEVFSETAKTQNTTIIQQQKTRVLSRSKRRISELEERILRFRSEGKEKMIPATDGLLKKEKNWEKEQLTRITMNENESDSEFSEIAGGIIIVKEE